MADGNQQPRRIVPKTAYARNVSRKAVVSTGMGLLAVSLLAAVAAIMLLVAMVSSVVAHIVPLWLSLLLLVCTGMLGGGGIFILYLGRFFVASQVLAVLIFKEKLQPSVWVGGALIVAGGCVLTFWQKP